MSIKVKIKEYFRAKKFNAKVRLLRFFSAIPIVGGLGDCPRKAKTHAFYEVLTTTVFATMPFWFPVFIALIIDNFDHENSFSNGEILIFGAGLMACPIRVVHRLS